MKFSFLKTTPPEHLQLHPNNFDFDWDNWLWQLRSSLKSRTDFEKWFTLTPEEKIIFSQDKSEFNIRSTPYYSALATDHPEDPIRKILMPHALEFDDGNQSLEDPLNEKNNNPTSRIIHRYPDRVLFLITDMCSVYCRYCTRKYFTGHEQNLLKKDELNNGLKYIKSHPEIREVILSGGDPLTLSTEKLSQILFEIRKIDHVEIIRIGTRMPVVCPMRVDLDLVKELKKYKPVFLMTHFNHPRELSLEAANALELFVDNGIPTFNQMVLLNGVNNHAVIVKALSRRLLYLRVKPYYMFQCDPSRGTDHLRTTIEDSEQIQRELWGKLSGLALPQLSIDIPNGGGKVGLTPNFEVSRNESGRSYQGWDQITAEYINPNPKNILKPIDIDTYSNEI